MLFKVCDREPELKALVLGVQGHPQRRAMRLAKQIAAAHNGIMLNTIEKAWDFYNPNKKARQAPDKTTSAERSSKAHPRSR